MKRREFSKIAAAGLLGAGLAPTILTGTAKNSTKPLKVAARRFETEVDVGEATFGTTGATVKNIEGPLKTTVLLFENEGRRICLVASDFMVDRRNTASFFRGEAAKILGLDTSQILLFSSHNHSVPKMLENELRNWNSYEIANQDLPEVKLLPVAKRFLQSLRQSIRELPGALEPAEVLFAQGSEGRITYNRKGRRADGSTYFMREEDRVLVGKDFNGDIDREVPVVVFQGRNGKPIAALMQFTGHPVSSYHPEDPTIFGDYPGIAADELEKSLGGSGQMVPVAFLQGCGGDTNSKEMFVAGIRRTREFGEMLGQSAIDTLNDLKPSQMSGMNYVTENVSIPLSPLPPKNIIQSEIDEMKDFIRRADAGDENTRSCVGLNFPRALTPEYRGALVSAPLAWNEWALGVYERGETDRVMRTLDVSVYVLRLGDASIIGMPFEPFLGLGRQMREQSPAPLTIPCGYVNGSHGYVTDSHNTGDREYMSAFYRYTRFRPPFAKPAGDVLANRAVEIIKDFWRG